MTDTKALNEIIEKSGLKKNYIAKCIGITAYGLSKKINNINEFKASEIETLCKLLKIDSLKDRQRIFFATEVD